MQGVVGAALNRRRELRARCTASASRNSAEAASPVLSTSPESWIARVGRANSSTRHHGNSSVKNSGIAGTRRTKKFVSKARIRMEARGSEGSCAALGWRRVELVWACVHWSGLLKMTRQVPEQTPLRRCRHPHPCAPPCLRHRQVTWNWVTKAGWVGRTSTPSWIPLSGPN